jgi:hypothetical protein
MIPCLVEVLLTSAKVWLFYNLLQRDVHRQPGGRKLHFDNSQLRSSGAWIIIIGGMRVTLKTVNEKLADLGTKAELAKGTGYFLFRGGEADDWIDRTVAVPTIGSFTLEQWLSEYKRLKALNIEMVKAARQASPGPAKTKIQRHAAPTRKTPPQRAAPASDSTPNEACRSRTKLLAELNQAHKDLVAIEEQEVRAARGGSVSDLVTLSAAATRERGKFDRALLAIRDHTLVHGC